VLLKQAVAAGEKTLLFSHSLPMLNLLERVLAATPSPRGGGGGWLASTDYYRLDGATREEEREQMVNAFNRLEHLRLFLISTRAGGVGLNLASASRVIIFDANWNPSHDQQAVYRVYRYGQTRPVYVYRLIAEGFEECMYKQQVVKLQLAGRVVDEQSIESVFSEHELKAWRHPLPPAADAPLEVAVLASLPADSWLPALGASPMGRQWLGGVADHNSSLEDTEETLSDAEQQEAANELVRDTIETGREEMRCQACGATRGGLSFRQLELRCAVCGAVTQLPPATPLVERESCRDEVGSLAWSLHSEVVGGSLLGEAGAYEVQRRAVPTQLAALASDEGWEEPHPVPRGALVWTRGLSPAFRYQLRVRARLRACACAPDAAGSAGQCTCWSPWSQPSAAAQPSGA